QGSQDPARKRHPGENREVTREGFSMKPLLKKKRPEISRSEFNRRAARFLTAIQEELMPEHADEFLAINMETGEYVLAADAHQADAKAGKRWPDVLIFGCRVDGGPVAKFYGK